MPRLLDSTDKACAKLETLAEGKNQEQVLAAADFCSSEDSADDLKTGFEAGVKTAKTKGNAYLLQLTDGEDAAIFLGKAEDIRKKLEKLDNYDDEHGSEDRTGDDEDEDLDDEDDEDEDEDEDEEIPDA